MYQKALGGGSRGPGVSVGLWEACSCRAGAPPLSAFRLMAWEFLVRQFRDALPLDALVPPEVPAPLEHGRFRQWSRAPISWTTCFARLGKAIADPGELCTRTWFPACARRPWPSRAWTTTRLSTTSCSIAGTRTSPGTRAAASWHTWCERLATAASTKRGRGDGPKYLSTMRRKRESVSPQGRKSASSGRTSSSGHSTG